jgi:hypothetical protein
MLIQRGDKSQREHVNDLADEISKLLEGEQCNSVFLALLANLEFVLEVMLENEAREARTDITDKTMLLYQLIKLHTNAGEEFLSQKERQGQ